MKSILAATVVVAMGTAGAHATDFGSATDPSVLSARPISGHIELFGQSVWQDFRGPDEPWLGGGAAGRLNWWLSTGTSMQFDLAGQFSSNAASADYNSFSFYGAAHYSMRNDQHLLGFFGGLAATSDYYASLGANNSIFGGIEGQAHLGPVTFYAQAGLARQLGGGYYSGTYNFALAFLYGELRYFFNPNTKVALNAGVVNGDLWGPGYPHVHTIYGAELEHRFGSMPVSIFARWQGLMGRGYYTMNGNRVMGGFRYNFGNSSLQDENLNGATLKVFQDLMPIGDMRSFD